AAVAAAHNSDTAAVHPVEALQVTPAVHHVLKVHVSVTPVVHVEESLAVARATAVVHGQHRVAVVGQELNDGVIAAAALASRPAMDRHEGWNLAGRRRTLRPIKKRGDLEAVEAGVADDC